MTLLGERNWYLPRWLARVMNREPSERQPQAVPVPHGSNAILSPPRIRGKHAQKRTRRFAAGFLVGVTVIEPVTYRV